MISNLQVHLVPYSEHSSYDELREYVGFLKPQEVKKLRVLKWHHPLQKALRCWHVLAAAELLPTLPWSSALHFLRMSPSQYAKRRCNITVCSRKAIVRTCRSFRR